VAAARISRSANGRNAVAIVAALAVHLEWLAARVRDTVLRAARPAGTDGVEPGGQLRRTFFNRTQIQAVAVDRRQQVGRLGQVNIRRSARESVSGTPAASRTW
jgi:hypothetical protein